MSDVRGIVSSSEPMISNPVKPTMSGSPQVSEIISSNSKKTEEIYATECIATAGLNNNG